MEKKKLDISQLIGFALIGAVFVWYSLTQKDNAPVAEETQTEIANTITQSEDNSIVPDSLLNLEAAKKYGEFAYSVAKGTSETGTTVLENDVLKLVIANKGGQITQAQLKNYTTYQQAPLYLINDANASFNIEFGTLENKIINTKNLIFEPTISKNGKNDVVSLKLKVSNSKYLEYRYELKPNNYMLDFSIRSVGLENVISSNNKINLEWDYVANRQEKSIKYENQMTALHYEKEDGKFDELSAGSKDDELEENVDWIAYKQHFFSTILLTKTPFEKAELTSESLVQDVLVDTVATKKFSTTAPLTLTNGGLNYDMNFYIGPNVHEQLASYDKGIENVMNLGWGIFGWINKVVFIPIFHLLSSFIGNYGLVIILMTLVVRLLMSPLVYKSYVSSAKMKVLKPEMDLINAKFPGKENQMKRQSEVMALQRKSGVNMMAGCIPALLQMPVFFALFRFFPSEIDLRQQPFLWADDLASYDSVFEWSTNIPLVSSFYGNHFSLFPVLASIAIFFYMRMNQSQQMNMQQPAQEGMPDMQKMMKMMMYFSPIMMLFFFNNYASGLSLYYFISNLLTLTIMYVIKTYVIDEEKILAKIHENRKKPKKVSKFKQRLDDAMKQAQVQQEIQKKNKKK
ncbi:membrane protein insertase YidC [Wenyingzhuangia sp. 2_MG-2023]|uniref:membrane protein insertase YidC n=1 Tax=Wenyingzhuangia sp. 2_MG-2023 TaxID=3062639 RepID=UPI0026E302E7|nr:membrane protein insertase YidC [Wenyingzhuangia sp. 2_MG-2023]MDO6738118.1 membrane protein insertase YidC [Wenyingzhuangia sp. 2_MG-2023]MDO6801558.1 membrane protein insertase YidC [Wenyingzhuangia sp. 1_MG-2023]